MYKHSINGIDDYEMPSSLNSKIYCENQIDYVVKI